MEGRKKRGETRLTEDCEQPCSDGIKDGRSRKPCMFIECE